MGVIQAAINRTIGAAATVTMAQHAIGQKNNALLEKQKMANDKAEQVLKAKQEQKKRYQVEKRRAYKTAIGNLDVGGVKLSSLGKDAQKTIKGQLSKETLNQLKTQADVEARRISGYNG